MENERGVSALWEIGAERYGKNRGKIHGKFECTQPTLYVERERMHECLLKFFRRKIGRSTRIISPTTYTGAKENKTYLLRVREN